MINPVRADSIVFIIGEKLTSESGINPDKLVGGRTRRYAKKLKLDDRNWASREAMAEGATRVGERRRMRLTDLGESETASRTRAGACTAVGGKLGTKVRTGESTLAAEQTTGVDGAARRTKPGERCRSR